MENREYLIDYFKRKIVPNPTVYQIALFEEFLNYVGEEEEHELYNFYKLLDEITDNKILRGRLDEYYTWYTKELDKRNKKLAKAPSDFAMDIIKNNFKSKLIEKQRALGISPLTTSPTSQQRAQDGGY